MDSPAPHDDTDDFARRLFHRWFVEYNPLYLLSAALVLGGLTLVSREVAKDGSVLGVLGVAAVAEVYAFALIGGAAFLVRMDLRRPAVMLALLAVLYQCDLTLHVETCAYLGAIGRVASALWAVLFVAKLYALAAALQLRPSRSAIVVPALGALGLAALPQIFREVDPASRTSLVALWIFGVGAAALWTSRSVESAVGYDVRGLRSLRAMWMLFAVLALGHVIYWSFENEVRLVALAPAVVLLTARWMRRERTVWMLAITTLAAVVVLAPASLSSTAIMVAVVLALRALRAPSEPVEPQVAPEQPYRGAVPIAPAAPLEPAFERARPAALHRLLAAAAWSAHLSLWTAGWAGGDWPEHRIVLDVALALACAFAVWKSRRALSASPVVVTYVHLGIAVGWITAPRDALQWGLASIGLGFALLVCALGATWRWRVREDAEPQRSSA